ncbi:MAG: hypothetical protein HYW47_04085 [Deltaproteobacteria bacterium]|nr:hypothetical protein [Deltaproteobacteria bacterium]
MNELDKNWVPLQQYSLKKGVSTSTLRRRIKTEKIKYKLHEGKYYIFCDAEEWADFEKETLNHEALNETLSLTREALQSVVSVSETASTYKDQVILEQKAKIELLEEEIHDLKTLISVLEEKAES